MTLETKLKDYFKANGIQMKWFAEKLGMPKQQLYHIVGGRAPLPDKYWLPLMELTNGEITFCDIIENVFGRQQMIEYKESDDIGGCYLSLRDFNTKR